MSRHTSRSEGYKHDVPSRGGSRRGGQGSDRGSVRRAEDDMSRHTSRSRGGYSQDYPARHHSQPPPSGSSLPKSRHRHQSGVHDAKSYYSTPSFSDNRESGGRRQNITRSDVTAFSTPVYGRDSHFTRQQENSSGEVSRGGSGSGNRNGPAEQPKDSFRGFASTAKNDAKENPTEQIKVHLEFEDGVGPPGTGAKKERFALLSRKKTIR